jgi:uncharacterized membrane protein
MAPITLKSVATRVPFPFWIGVVLIITAIFLGGVSLAISTGYRFIGGLIGGVIALFVTKRISRNRALKR